MSEIELMAAIEGDLAALQFVLSRPHPRPAFPLALEHATNLWLRATELRKRLELEAARAAPAARAP